MNVIIIFTIVWLGTYSQRLIKSFTVISLSETVVSRLLSKSLVAVFYYQNFTR